MAPDNAVRFPAPDDGNLTGDESSAASGPGLGREKEEVMDAKERLLRKLAQVPADDSIWDVIIAYYP